MKLDYSILPKGSVYVRNTHSGDICVVDPSRIPPSFMGTDFILIEEVVIEVKEKEVVVEDEVKFVGEEALEVLKEEAKEIVEEVVPVKVKKISNYSNRGKRK